MDEHFRKLENMYLGANVNRLFYETTRLNIESEKCVISLDVDPKYFHALNSLHGSVYFKLLDDSAFFSAQSIIEKYFILTASFEIKLLRPVTKGTIKAFGKFQRKEGRSLWADSTLYDENDKIVAEGSGRFVVSNFEMTGDVGYK